MGEVYEAEHMDLERKVALKILLADLGRSPKVVEQFRHEARTASKVGSDNIVELYDFAELPDGRVLYTMELLSGPTLAKEIPPGGFPPGRAIAILRQLCKGLQAAHSAGIVHRDIKPDNIVLETFKGRADTVKILDFGIATILDDESSDQPLAAGTPNYIAPELISGRPFDHRVDIYSLGCTAYEMLTGKPPFSAEGPDAVSVILGHHLSTKPDRVRARRREITPELDAVIMRCLEKEPENRFRDMEALEAALCEAQIENGLQTTWDDLPLPEGVDPEIRERLLREMPDFMDAPPRRRGWLWPLVTTVALLAGAGTTYLLVQPRIPDAVTTEPHDDEVGTLVEAARAAAAKTYFVYPPVGEPGEPTAYSKVRELEELGTSEARARAKELRSEFAETLVRLGDTYWEKESGKPFALDYYKQALVFDRENRHAASRAALDPSELDALERKASEQSFSEEEIEAAAPLQALAEVDETVRARKLQALRKGSDRGSSPTDKIDQALQAAGGEPATAKGTSDPETTPAEAEDPPPPPPKPVDATSRESADEFVRGAKDYLAKGQVSQAKVYFERALSYDPNNTSALLGLYDLAFANGDFSKAKDYAERLTSLVPHSAKHHVRLGDALFKLARYAAARDAYQRAVDLGSTEARPRLQKAQAKAPAVPQPAEDEDESEDETKENEQEEGAPP